MQKQSHDNVILELTVRNHPGVMTHVCGLFARRAFNVEGIRCLPIQGSDPVSYTHLRAHETEYASRMPSSA